jgi:hypothetical protein
VAAAIISKSSGAYTLKKGGSVIEPSGEDMKVTRPVSEKVRKQVYFKAQVGF